MLHYVYIELKLVGTGSEQIGIALMLVLPAIMQNGQGSDE
jgi:hypothetical protein